MQIPKAFRTAALAAVCLLAACGRTDDPYAKIENPPLVAGRLHTVTLAGDAAVAQRLREQGYAPATFASNYPVSVQVEATLWGVPETAVSTAQYFRAPAGRLPHVRLLELPAAPDGTGAPPAIEASYFRKVLGTEVPVFPREGLPAGVRVIAWTYFLDDILEAQRRLRAAAIPVIFNPVGLTTAYLGDHKRMAVRAPDGTLIELVESAAD
jgi:hypothetical protein